MAVYAVRQVVSFASGLHRPSEYPQQGPDEKLGRGLAVPDMSDRVPLAGAAAATLAMWGSAMESCRRCPRKKLSAMTQQMLLREEGARAKQL